MRMYVRLYPEEAKALGELAQRERRDPRDQAALFIRHGLQGAGVLPLDETRKRCLQGGRRENESQK